MDAARKKRKQEINRALAFIQSSLAYPDPKGYQDFLTQLVCNLLDEGNVLFRDGEGEQAVREFSEGLNISSYAAAESIQVPDALLQSLHVNRATAYHNMGEYECAVSDCDEALALCKESKRALHQKALSLKELGRYQEAYGCTTDCLLISCLDKEVNDLAQELAVHLGLRNRKPYVSAKVGQKDHTLLARGVANGNISAEVNMVSGANLGNPVNPLSGLAPVSFPSMPQGPVPDMAEDTELMGADLDSLLDGFSGEHETKLPAPFSLPRGPSSSALPAPTPQLPPAFFSSAVGPLDSLDSFSTGGGPGGAELDSLDELDVLPVNRELDALDEFCAPGAVAGLGPPPGATLNGLDSLDDFLVPGAAQETSEGPNPEEKTALSYSLDELDDLEAEPGLWAGAVGVFGDGAPDKLDSLDILDSFSLAGVGASLPGAGPGTGLDSFSDFCLSGLPGSHSAAALVTRTLKNSCNDVQIKAPAASSKPLSNTHDFLQACSTCFPQDAPSVYKFTHKPDLVHSCSRDILLCRRKAAAPSDWLRVRPMPLCTSFKGPFILCREPQGQCRYRDQCMFAYNQLEIDVWTEERKGTLDRDLLFQTAAAKVDPVTCIVQLLRDHKGTFMFLCQECYDGKPRIISNRCKDNTCSNKDVHHTFDSNRCLVFVVSTHNVNYHKIRPLSDPCQLDLCYRAVRFGCGCQREDGCHHAHSVIELKSWKIQRNTGISADEMVRVATKFYDDLKQNKQKWNKQPGNTGNGSKARGRVGGGAKNLNLQIKLACAQCWRDGQIREPDKDLKFCTAKARHIWTKDRRVLLVMSSERKKWVQVRPLPNAKSLPMQYEMCAQMLRNRSCNYTGNCTFAHSQEEREVWTFMKNNSLRDIQEVHDTWTKFNSQSRQSNGATPPPAQEEKYIVMPTDFAEPMIGFHCRLCGKHSNSERQWQNHISSDKHKERVFSCEGEDEALTWSYRFPGHNFDLCPKLTSGCSEGVSCDSAHCLEELSEWRERRDFLRQKLAKAREDMLIMPDEDNFGMYNFLLQD